MWMFRGLGLLVVGSVLICLLLLLLLLLVRLLHHLLLLKGLLRFLLLVLLVTAWLVMLLLAVVLRQAHLVRPYPQPLKDFWGAGRPETGVPRVKWGRRRCTVIISSSTNCFSRRLAGARGRCCYQRCCPCGRCCERRCTGARVMEHSQHALCRGGLPV